MPAARRGRVARPRRPVDLIYLHSANYCPGLDEPLVLDADTFSLRSATHRKLTTAYALSRRGVETLAGCGFRESVFSVDDFLPALYGAGHPRPDAGSEKGDFF